MKYGKTKTERDPRTGKQITKKNTSGDAVELDAPWLRIIVDETFDTCQEALAVRAVKPSVRDSRHPDYLPSDKTRCGLCGGAFAMTTATLGCVNRRVRACTNTRRVPRERVEKLVLEGLCNRSVCSPILAFFLPEYHREYAQARVEAAASQVGCEARLKEVEGKLTNLMKQVRAGTQGFPAQMLNEDLTRLGTERERLKPEPYSP